VRREDGEVTVECTGGPQTVADELLVGLGREPRTRDLGVEVVGLEPGKTIDVDERMRTRVAEWLYAVGDVNGRALLTHMGKYQGRIAADHILGKDVSATADKLGSPRVTFTDPEVAAVGRTLAAAREAGINARAVDVPTSRSAGASFHGRNAPGTSRLVVDEDRRVIVGATFVGPETAEWVHAATVAVVGEVSLDDLWHAVPAFPTRSEVWLKLMEEYGL
jgi:pyruvate/2-oxoglutarate dehydrogenase complex dihydrolipoamide dehydrogenase (E3) component